MAPDKVDGGEYANILQIGTRNMQNYPLLQAIGKARTPVLLKRGMMSTIEELLIRRVHPGGGQHARDTCERGIRTFETYTRNTTGIKAAPPSNIESPAGDCRPQPPHRKMAAGAPRGAGSSRPAPTA